MKLKASGLRSGKTIQLIIDSSISGFRISVPDQKRMQQIINLAARIGVEIEKPILCEQSNAIPEGELSDDSSWVKKLHDNHSQGRMRPAEWKFEFTGYR